MLMTWVLHGSALLVAWTGWSHSLHGPALLLVPTFFSARWFYLAGTHCTIPTSALLFGGNIFTHPCFYILYGMQITHGQSTYNASKQQWQPTFCKGHSLNHGRVCNTIAQCGLCLGGQPRVGCGRWVKDILQLPMFG